MLGAVVGPRNLLVAVAPEVKARGLHHLRGVVQRRRLVNEPDRRVNPRVWLWPPNRSLRRVPRGPQGEMLAPQGAGAEEEGESNGKVNQSKRNLTRELER